MTLQRKKSSDPDQVTGAAQNLTKFNACPFTGRYQLGTSCGVGPTALQNTGRFRDENGTCL